MQVLTRYRVPEAERASFASRAEAALRVLSTRPGFTGGEVGHNVDDPELWSLVTRWVDVGSYRRGLGGFEAKSVVVPLLSLALDEPSAYAVVVATGPSADGMA